MRDKPFKITVLLSLIFLFFCSCSGEISDIDLKMDMTQYDLGNSNFDISPKENIRVEVKFPEESINVVDIEKNNFVSIFILDSKDFVSQIDSFFIENRCNTKNSVYYNVLASSQGQASQILAKNVSLKNPIIFSPPLFITKGWYVQISIQISSDDLQSGDKWCWFISQGGIKGTVGEHEIVSPEVTFGTIVKK